jgi:hypothetical protein
MLPGDMPGRGAPGRGPPGRGACGRGMGRSTGCADENGLLPTRGVRPPGFGTGRGPGVAPGVGPGRAALGAGGACGCSAAGPGVGDGSCAGSAACGLGSTDGLGTVGFPGFAGALAASTFAAAAPLPVALTCARFAPPNDSRNRRATGASTVEDADLTNSPCSLSRARTCLLVTPSSLANSCTRALPATTSPVYEATAVVGRASGLAMTHGHRDFTVCSCSLLPILLPG